MSDTFDPNAPERLHEFIECLRRKKGKLLARATWILDALSLPDAGLCFDEA
jgi:hypothetical protein